MGANIEYAMAEDIAELKDVSKFCNCASGNCDIIVNGNTFVKSVPAINDGEEFCCGESGSSLRFLIPLALLAGKNMVFSGEGRLVSRPLEPYFEIFERVGINYKYDNGLPLNLSGVLKSGDYKITGDVSSQFISGLLMALPLCDGDSTLSLTSELESKNYVDMTIDVLNKFGVYIEQKSNTIYCISGNQRYQYESELEQHTYETITIVNEGDCSQSAFWAVAAAIGVNPIYIQNINRQTLQGDIVIYELLEKMGVKLEWLDNGVKVFPSNIKNMDISVKDYPDLVPILAVLGTAAQGVMKIKDAKRLRFKESDRLHAIATELNKLGADIIQIDDGLIVNGVLKNGDKKLIGGIVDSHSDHRIAMALSIASIICESPVFLSGFDSVNKSYPDFFDVYKSLGGLLEVM